MMCLSKASNESQKRRCCCFYVLKAKQDLCRFLVHRPGQSVVTNYGFPPNVHFNSLVKSSPVIIVLAGKDRKPPLHAAQISVTKCDISCLQLKSAVTSPPCLWPGKLAAVLERFHRLSIQSQRCCSFWQRVAGFPSGRKSAEKRFCRWNEPHQRLLLFYPPHFILYIGRPLNPCRPSTKTFFFFFSFWYTVLHSRIQICSLYDKRNLTESVSAVEISIFC